MFADLWSRTEAPRVHCGEAREQSWKSQLRPKSRFIDALPKFSVLQVRIIENIAGVCHRIPDHFAPKCLVEEFGFRILHEYFLSRALGRIDFCLGAVVAA